MSKKIGLALSGGGVRGAAHVGVLQFMHELEIPVHIIAGTSAGAIVGSLLAAGNEPASILEVFKKIRLFDYSRMTWAKPGLLDGDSFQDLLDSYFSIDDFKDLPKELLVVGTDLLEGGMHVFEEGPVIKAVLASAAYPVIFSPIKFEEKLYVDGGVFNNFPADLIKDRCDLLIGVNVNPIPGVQEKDLGGTWQIMMRVMELTLQQKDLWKSELCDLYLEPMEILPYNIFDTYSVDEIFEVGYNEAKKYKTDFLRLMEEA